MPCPGYLRSYTTFPTTPIPIALDINYCYHIDGKLEPWRDQGAYLSKTVSLGWQKVKESGEATGTGDFAEWARRGIGEASRWGDVLGRGGHKGLTQGQPRSGD